MAHGLGAHDRIMAGGTPRTEGDARLDRAATLVPIARALFEMAKAQADAIGQTERRFGSPEVMHLARLLDDLWMACDSLVTDCAKSGE
jgi:hypothetical protein